MASVRPAGPASHGRPTQRFDVTAGGLIATGGALLAIAICLTVLATVAETPAVLPALAAGAVVVAGMLLRPKWIFPAFLGLTWTSLKPSILGGVPSPIEVGALIFMGVAVVLAFRRPSLTRETALVTIILGLSVLVSALTSTTGVAFESLLPFFKTLVFLPIAALCVITLRDAERVATALAITGAILGAGAIFSVLVGPTPLFQLQNLDDINEAPRAVGQFGEATFFALSLAVLMPFALYHVAKGGKAMLFGAATAVLLTGGVLAAGSRGSLMTIVFVLLLFGWWSGSRRLRLAGIGVVGMVLLLLPLFAAQAASSRERTVSGRATENVIAAQMWADYPLTGVGHRQYPVLYRDYARYTGNDERVLREPHNLVLEIAAEQGVVGVLSWIIAGLVVAFSVVRARLWTSMLGKSVLMAFFAYFFVTLFQHGSQNRLLFMLVGLTLAMSAAIIQPRRPQARSRALT